MNDNEIKNEFRKKSVMDHPYSIETKGEWNSGLEPVRIKEQTFTRFYQKFDLKNW